ncbi:4Fe-4S dicluster domain-containing protein [Lentisalinibacter sediminis]|uniref:4Fe-4S dicluster domain-containing protein n=1 Tax=Lentisalinibacter sediminis TaxID=2992237 RepID=UPI003866627E
MMTDLTLPEQTTDGRARAEALDDRHRTGAEPTSLVSFLSRGRVLIVGEEEEGLAAAQRLGDGLVVTLFAPAESRPATGDREGFTLIRGGRPRLSGSLGNYAIRLPESGAEDADSPATKMIDEARFDLVLDLGDPPLLRQEALPPGYYAPRGDAAALEAALEELPQMRGEFEKPKFFNYDPEICAHGNRGIRGCTRCLDVCPAWAITSVGERISVDPNLCQGFGSCAAVCPTGAITYAFPSTEDLLAYVSKVLGIYRESGGSDPRLVFFDAASAGALSTGLAGHLPENVLPIELEEVGSLGLEAWLACLAYGAGRVLILTGPETPRSLRDVLDRETEVTGSILAGMGYPAAVQPVDTADPEALDEAVRSDAVLELGRPARFAPPPEKRLLLRTALNLLLEQAPAPKKVVPLPKGAAFGQVRVDTAACTLCMSCVAVCPTSALREGQGLPQLNFLERSCIQCGMCETACPEDAVTLEPRFLYDDARRSTPRLLHEEQPMCCISCGKPFATRSMIEVMRRKLESHWMFQSEEDRRRLEMCDTCRVKDLMRARQGSDQGDL